MSASTNAIPHRIYQFPLPPISQPAWRKPGAQRWRELPLDFGERPAQPQLNTSAHSLRLIAPTVNAYPDDEIDGESQSRYSPIEQLPSLSEWVDRYTVTALEIWGGRRPATQLARWSHRIVYLDLMRKAGLLAKSPKLRRIHLTQPLAGIAEVVAILNMENRTRALALRFEGVNGKWLCTHLQLI